MAAPDSCPANHDMDAGRLQSLTETLQTSEQDFVELSARTSWLKGGEDVPGDQTGWGDMTLSELKAMADKIVKEYFEAVEGIA